MQTEFQNKTVAVVGLARSGRACCDVLTRLGATVIPWDSKPAADLTEAVAELAALRLTPLTGGAVLDYAALDYVVTSPGVRKDAAVLQGAVAAGVPVLGEIEAAYRIARAPILAITGTNGKTTTTVLLAEMLKAAGIQTYIAGNIAAGDIALPLIRAAYEAPAEAAIVAEISSFQLEWVSTFRPKVAALLNITPDHGDRQTWEEYVAAKWRIFEFQTADDVAVSNANLPSDASAINDHMDGFMTNAEVIWWSFDAEPQEWNCDRSVWMGGTTIYVSPSQEASTTTYATPMQVDGKEIKGEVILSPPTAELCQVADIKLPGAHNLENIMAAAAMATAFGVGVEPIRQVVTTFTGVVHRLEYVGTMDGVKYVNNSMCTNADAFDKSLAALPEPKVVIAGGVFKGGDVGQLGKSVAAHNVRALVLIGRSAPEIDAAALAAGFTDTHRAGTLAEAVAMATGLAQPGDTVLLAPACASFDMFRDFEDRGDQFKELVRNQHL